MPLETNIRLVAPGPNLYVPVRRMAAKGQNLDPDLLERACSRLRRSTGVGAVPDPGSVGVLLVASTHPTPPVELKDSDWQIKVEDIGEPHFKLYAQKEPDLVASLVERALLSQVARSSRFWSLQGPRIWYESSPFQVEKDITAFRRFELSALSVADAGIGVIADIGTAFFSAFTVDHFFDPGLSALEKSRRLERFGAITGRQEGQKGTLAYDNGRNKTVCYFEEAPPGLTCATTGHLVVRGRDYGSLHEYYRVQYPHLDVSENDAAVRVSFPGLGRPQPVAARLLTPRVMNDNVPPRLSSVDKVSPEVRRSLLQSFWASLGDRPLGSGLPGLLPGFWTPPDQKVRHFLPPAVRFASSKAVPEPRCRDAFEFRKYYNSRRQLMDAGHVFRFPPAAARTIQIAYPSKYGEAAGQLGDDLAHTLGRWTNKQFNSNLVPYDVAGDAYARLKGYEEGVVLFVLDGEPAAYYEASFNLPGWRVKRVMDSTLDEQFRYWSRGVWDRNKRRETLDAGKRRWDSFIAFNALEVLQLLDAVPYRTDRLGPFESQLAIDVGYDRRFFAVSLLVCRDSSKLPDFGIYTRVYPKADHKNETINPQLLQDAILDVFDVAMKGAADPLDSLLVLRDGRLVGTECQGIEGAATVLRRDGALSVGSRLDVVEFRKSSLKNLRLWEVRGDEVSNPLEGTGVSLGPHAFVLCSTGASTLTQGTVEPVMIVGLGRDAPLHDAALSAFSAAQLNWSSPGVAQRLPLPLKRTDDELTARSAQEIRRIR